jgi:amino acid permease
MLSSDLDMASSLQFAQTSYIIFEATVINTLVEYWGYDQNPAILITISLVLYLAINVYRADLFGEVECRCKPLSQKRHILHS